SRLQLDRAATDGPRTRVLAAGNGKTAERRQGPSQWARQYRRRGRGGRSRGDEGRTRDRRAAAARRSGLAPVDAWFAQRDRRAHRRGSRIVQDAAEIGRSARRVRGIYDAQALKLKRLQPSLDPLAIGLQKRRQD